jgi:hypothetical protein
MTAAAFEQFPLNGRLYRLISEGQIHEPSSNLSRPCVKMCLAEMQDLDNAEPTYARNANEAVTTAGR